MENGLSVTFTIQLSAEDLAKLPHQSLKAIAGIGAEIMLAQAKPVIAELERSCEVHRNAIKRLTELGEVLKQAANTGKLDNVGEVLGVAPDVEACEKARAT